MEQDFEMCTLSRLGALILSANKTSDIMIDKKPEARRLGRDVEDEPILPI